MSTIDDAFDQYETAEQLRNVPFTRDDFAELETDSDGNEYGRVDGVTIPVDPAPVEMAAAEPVADDTRYLRDGQVTNTPPPGVSVQFGRSDTDATADVGVDEPGAQADLSRAKDTDFMRGVVRGLGKASKGIETTLPLAGAPLDLINDGLRAIGVPVSDEPFMGSEDIKQGISAFMEWADRTFIPETANSAFREFVEAEPTFETLQGVTEDLTAFGVQAIAPIKVLRAFKVGNPLVRGMTWGAIADFINGQPDQGLLVASLVETLTGATREERGAVANAIFEVLQTNEDDPAYIAKTKNMLDGLIIGGGIDGGVALLIRAAKVVPWGQISETLVNAGRAADERIADLSRGGTMMANPAVAAADVAISGAGRVANTLSPSIRRKALELVQDPIVDDELPSLLDVLEKKADEMAFKPVDRTQPSGDQMFDVEPESYVRHIDPALQVETPVPRAPEGAKLPLKARAAGLVERMDEVASVLAERARPYVGTNVQYFYHLGPLISKAEALGIPRQEAKENIRDFALLYGATSPRTRTEPNLRSASLVRAKQSEGIEYNEVIGPRRDGLNEVGYPMMINEAVPGTGAGIHKILIERVRDTGVIDYRTNPKPATFVENVNGNLNGITVDTHAIRAALHVLNELSPGSLPQQWFKPAAYKAYLADPSDINNYAGKEVVDTLAGQVVDGIKQQTEYALFSDLYRLVAEKLNVQPAEAQSLSWFANGKYTDLGSPPKTIVELVNERVDVTAQALGKTKDAIFKGFIQGKIPLMSVGGALVGVNSLRQPDAKQAPDS